MRQAKIGGLLAAVAAVMITSATFAAPQDTERSYLPPQSSRSQEVAKSAVAPSPEAGRLPHRGRTRTRHRHFARDFQAGPPDMFFFPGMLFPFF
jgi:hypothetical protein